MSKIIDWQDRNIRDVLIQLYKVYKNSIVNKNVAHGTSYKIEKLFYEKTGKRINYITLREKIREIAGEE
jgi:hypothetical protein